MVSTNHASSNRPPGVLPYLAVYKSTPILEPKNKFFLFLGKNFLETLIFYLRIFFQVRYCYTKKICPELFLVSAFDPCINWGWFFGPSSKRLTYTWVNMVNGIWWYTSGCNLWWSSILSSDSSKNHHCIMMQKLEETVSLCAILLTNKLLIIVASLF